jgi:hypothetical protein
MKPKWKDAPSWAQYLAENKKGNWAWFQNKPRPFVNTWVADGYVYGCKNTDWKQSLEERPKECQH